MYRRLFLTTFLIHIKAKARGHATAQQKENMIEQSSKQQSSKGRASNDRVLSIDDVNVCRLHPDTKYTGVASTTTPRQITHGREVSEQTLHAHACPHGEFTTSCTSLSKQIAHMGRAATASSRSSSKPSSSPSPPKPLASTNSSSRSQSCIQSPTSSCPISSTSRNPGSWWEYTHVLRSEIYSPSSLTRSS